MPARHILDGRVNLTSGVVNLTLCSKALELSDEEKEAWREALQPNAGEGRSKRQTTGIQRGCHGDKLKQYSLLFGLPSLDFDALDDLEAKKDFDAEDEEDSDEENDDNGDGLIESTVQSAKCNKRLIGYYSSWGTRELTYTQASKLTHIVFAFMQMHVNGTVTVGSADPTHSADIEADTRRAQVRKKLLTLRKKMQERLTGLMSIVNVASHLKVQFAVGGWENSQYFSAVAADPRLRLNFIASILRLIDEWGFDGVDLDWEYPVTGGAKEGMLV